MAALQLPAGFAALEPFVGKWVLPDASARMATRLSSRIEDIRAFYEVALGLGEAALAHLRGFALGDLPEPEERVLKLMLSLAECAPAVEWYGAPEVYDGFPIERIRFVRQISDTAAQG